MKEMIYYLSENGEDPLIIDTTADYIGSSTNELAPLLIDHNLGSYLTRLVDEKFDVATLSHATSITLDKMGIHHLGDRTRMEKLVQKLSDARTTSGTDHFPRQTLSTTASNVKRIFTDAATDYNLDANEVHRAVSGAMQSHDGVLTASTTSDLVHDAASASGIDPTMLALALTQAVARVKEVLNLQVNVVE